MNCKLCLLVVLVTQQAAWAAGYDSNTEGGTQQCEKSAPYMQCNNMLQVQSSLINLMTTTMEYSKQISSLNDKYLKLTEDFVQLKQSVNDKLRSNHQLKIQEAERDSNKDHPRDYDTRGTKDKRWNTILQRVDSRHQERHAGSHDRDSRSHDGVTSQGCNCGADIKRLEGQVRNLTSQIQSDTSTQHNLMHKMHKVENDMHSHNRHIHRMERNMATLTSRRETQSDSDPRHMTNMVSQLTSQLRQLQDEVQQMRKERESDPVMAPPIATTPVAGTSPCQEGWEHYMKSCYKFENVSATWPVAERHCNNIQSGAHLVSVETKQENDFIIAFREYNEEPWSSPWWWAGGTDTALEGEWRWVGTNRPITFHYWSKMAADAPEEEEAADCMYYTANGDHRWDDWSCDSIKINFVCELMLH